MPEAVIKDPQIFISQEARTLLDNIKKLEEFKSFENKDLFLLALLFGISKKRVPLRKHDKTQNGYTRERYLTESDLAILKAVAVRECNDIAIINDIPAVFAIAEEYANAGLGELKEFVYDNPAEIVKKLASKLKKAKK